MKALCEIIRGWQSRFSVKHAIADIAGCGRIAVDFTILSNLLSPTTQIAHKPVYLHLEDASQQARAAIPVRIHLRRTSHH